jgi:hypothetical protein
MALWGIVSHSPPAAVGAGDWSAFRVNGVAQNRGLPLAFLGKYKGGGTCAVSWFSYDLHLFGAAHIGLVYAAERLGSAPGSGDLRPDDQ